MAKSIEDKGRLCSMSGFYSLGAGVVIRPELLAGAGACYSVRLLKPVADGPLKLPR